MRALSAYGRRVPLPARFEGEPNGAESCGLCGVMVPGYVRATGDDSHQCQAGLESMSVIWVEGSP